MARVSRSCPGLDGGRAISALLSEVHARDVYVSSGHSACRTRKHRLLAVYTLTVSTRCIERAAYGQLRGALFTGEFSQAPHLATTRGPVYKGSPSNSSSSGCLRLLYLKEEQSARQFVQVKPDKFGSPLQAPQAWPLIQKTCEKTFPLPAVGKH